MSSQPYKHPDHAVFRPRAFGDIQRLDIVATAASALREALKSLCDLGDDRATFADAKRAEAECALVAKLSGALVDAIASDIADGLPGFSPEPVKSCFEAAISEIGFPRFSDDSCFDQAVCHKDLARVQGGAK